MVSSLIPRRSTSLCRGVPRGALMHAALRYLGRVPVTLVATEDGLPLYRSLGFRAVGDSTWWRVRSG